MTKLLLRSAASVVVAVGVLLLVSVLYRALTGSLVVDVFGSPKSSAVASLGALALSLPVPLHVISIGLIVQRRWLSAPWQKVAWVAIVVSGVWLGAALAIKMAIL